MKKLLLFLTAVLSAQSVQVVSVRTVTRSATGADANVPLTGSGANYHLITWYPTDAAVACTVKLEQSTNGSSWSDLIAATSCATKGESTATAGTAVSFVRINVTALTAGASVTVKYTGYTANPAAAGGDGAVLDGVSSSIRATVVDYTNSNPLTVRLTDTNGDYVAAGAGTQYTEDDASAANPVGGQLIARRRDTPASETTTDGDVTALNSTAKGELYVKHIDSIPVTAASLPLPTGAATEATLATRLAEATFTGRINTQGQKAMAASTPVVIASDQSAVLVDGSAVTQPVSGTVTANVGTFPDNEPFNLNQLAGTALAVPFDADSGGGTQNLIGVSLRKIASGGSVEAGTASDPLRIDPTGTTTQPVSAASLPLPTGASTLAEQQTQTTALQKIDNAVYTNDAAISEVAGIGAQFDDTAPGTTTENSVRSLRMSTRRELYGQIRDAAGNERGANVTAGNALVVDGSAVTQPVSGTVTANLATGDNTVGRVKITDGTLVGSVRDTGASDSVNVSIVDASGNQITSFGGGTQYTEDDASAANPIGTQLIARRRDALSSETTTDGDVTAINSTAKGEIYVKHVDSIPLSDAPTTPTNTYVTDASIAVAATDNLDTGELGASKLAQVEVVATTSYRAALYTIANGAASANPVGICGGQAYQPCILTAPHRDYWQVAASAGVDGYRLAVTNTDAFNAAAAHAVFHTEQ